MLPSLELEKVLSESYQFFSENVEKIEKMPFLIFSKIKNCKDLYEKVNFTHKNSQIKFKLACC